MKAPSREGRRVEGVAVGRKSERGEGPGGGGGGGGAGGGGAGGGGGRAMHVRADDGRGRFT